MTEVRFFSERGRDRLDEYLDNLTCLVWRPFPDGGDGIEIVHFQQAWGDDLDRPKIWPRD